MKFCEIGRGSDGNFAHNSKYSRYPKLQILFENFFDTRHMLGYTGVSHKEMDPRGGGGEGRKNKHSN